MLLDGVSRVFGRLAAFDTQHSNYQFIIWGLLINPAVLTTNLMRIGQVITWARSFSSC